MKTKTYIGTRDKDRTAFVTIQGGPNDGGPLPPRLDLANHSPTGLEWGYAGSGPAQLALALVADATGDDEFAVFIHQRFKFAVVCLLNRDGWTLTSEQIASLARGLTRQ